MADTDITRRQFGKRAAEATAIGSLAILGTGFVSSEDSQSLSIRADEPPPAIAEPIPPAAIPMEVLLLEVVRQLYPDRKLTHQYLDDVRRDIAGELRRAEVIRQVPLNNANEPAGMFAAYRAND